MTPAELALKLDLLHNDLLELRIEHKATREIAEETRSYTRATNGRVRKVELRQAKREGIEAVSGKTIAIVGSLASSVIASLVVVALTGHSVIP